MKPNKNPPPTCNTGVEKKILSQRIHWLEVTFKSEKDKKLPATLPQEGTECYPLHGYNTGLKFSDGRMEFTHTTRPDMGLHIQWDGASLDALTITPLELVQFLSGMGVRFTRIDLAVDAHNYNLRPQDATEQINAKKHRCRSKKNPIFADATLPGYTQNLGTNASEIHLRIYDKAAEMGVAGDWTRVELVCRGFRAQTAAQTIVRGTDFRSLVKGYADFPAWPEWCEIMVADAIALPAEKKETATDLWLLNQCAKTLARRLEERGDDELWFMFVDMVSINRQEFNKIHNVA
jgi:hypothetical protein